MKKGKILGKLLAAALVATCLVACGDDTTQNNTSSNASSNAQSEALLPTQIYENIKSGYELPDMYEADADWLMNYYGIDASVLDDYVFAEGDEVHADRVIILKVKDEADIPPVQEKLEALLGQLQSPEMLSYLPEQADMIKEGSVKKQGDVLYLVISPDADGIEKVIVDGLSGR